MTKPGSYSCDVCKHKIIDLEHRFHCVDCGNFDMCPSCFSKKSHDASHTIQQFCPSQLIVVDYGDIKENSIRCNSCKKYITKQSERYHCLDCFDVDMCKSCYKSQNYFKDHQSSHKLELFTYCVGIPLTGKDSTPSKTESNVEVQKLQQENSKLQQETSKLQQEQSKLQQENSKLKQENSKLQQDLSRANSQNTQTVAASEPGIAYFPVSLVSNPLGGFTLTANAIGTECLFGFNSEEKKRTVFIDKRITEGVFHFLIKFAYGKGQSQTAFDIGVALSNNLKQFNDKTLGELPGSCCLGLGMMGVQAVSIMDGVNDKEKTMSMVDTAPDGALVGCEIDTAARTVSFFVEGKKFPRAVSGVRNPLNFGFDGAGHVAVTPISLRRLPSATPSAVKPVFFECKN